MKNFTLKIKGGNEAMNDDLAVAAALRKVAQELDNGKPAGIVMDVNGNKVGEWRLT